MSVYGRAQSPVGAEGLPLFKAPRLPARNTDPESSRRSARQNIASGDNARQRAFCLEMVRNYPGRTALELDQQFGFDRVFGRRLSELEADGLVAKGEERICTASKRGRKCVTWYATRQGGK